MSIEKGQYESIVESLKIGNSVAEFDSLLESARVETPVFDDILRDKYDIIFGRKGAGKTAMFKIIVDILSNYMLLDRNIVILSGVNSNGESIFNQYKEQFNTFSEQDFESFWKLYFISLIFNEFIKNEKYSEVLKERELEIKNFIKECEKAGIPNITSMQDKSQIIKWLVGIFSNSVKKIKVDMKVDINTPTLFTVTPEIEFDTKEEKEEVRQAIYVNDIGIAIKNLLQKSGIKIWIILDRLDEVFDRYSSIEFRGLRGLLAAYKSFIVDNTSDSFRIKLFLRDDVIEFLTNDKIYKKYFGGKNIPPLTAATHIFAKQSPILNWTEDEIQQLILNRLLLNKKLRLYLGISEDLDENALKEHLKLKANRQKYWDQIFPVMISTSHSLKWIFTRLKDSNGIVTPRSVIDMLEGAVSHLRKKIHVNYEDSDQIFSVESIKEGLLIASKNKLEKDIYNEFPKDQDNIKKLSKEGKIKLTKKDFERLYGKNWEDVVVTLNRIGILKYVKDSDSYRIEYLFRPALNMAYMF